MEALTKLLTNDKVILESLRKDGNDL